MASVYDKDAFAARVNYAAACILKGGSRIGTRHFDTCFEMDDGDVVGAAIMRRADNNPKLMAAVRALFSGGVIDERWQTSAARYAHVPTRMLRDEARRARERAETESKAALAKLYAEQDARNAAAARE